VAVGGAGVGDGVGGPGGGPIGVGINVGGGGGVAAAANAWNGVGRAEIPMTERPTAAGNARLRITRLFMHDSLRMLVLDVRGGEGVIRAYAILPGL
jgi:hypothetical protein